MTCLVCKVLFVGTKSCLGYCEGVEDGCVHEWCLFEHCGIPWCVWCGVLNKLSVLRNFPYCPKMGAAERALLERDIAEVERALREWKDSAVRLQVEAEEASATSRYEAIYGRRKQWGHGRESDAMIDRRVAGAATLYAEARMYRDMAADCEAWLARARAALGGGA